MLIKRVGNAREYIEKLKVNHKRRLLDDIRCVLDKEISSIDTTIHFYNHHLSVVNPLACPLTVIISGTDARDLKIIESEYNEKKKAQIQEGLRISTNSSKNFEEIQSSNKGKNIIIEISDSDSEKNLNLDDPNTLKLKEKWEEDDMLTRASILNHVQDDLIPLYEDFKSAKETMNALEDKYGPKSNTYLTASLGTQNSLDCLGTQIALLST
ncbi:hypothetical protein L1049_028283 [Liquidambar formosana]|uniref:Uncharacterized protein n=1 Tax=Liquidambar formosana TaxID=63359 RepID=A0AAP0WWB3_LIQFO